MGKGKFLNFLLTFTGKTADQQATEILDKAQELVGTGVIGVGITYSANYQQTQSINKTYTNGGWNTNTGGINQASVMTAMESLESSSYAKLQGKMRIIPITTMTYSDFGSKTLDEVTADDMENIENLLNQGWIILGWINVTGSKHYAVGGGVAKKIYAREPNKGLSPAQSASIQATLAGFHQQFT